MTKKSKLPEKATRTPDLNKERLNKDVSRYLSAVQELPSEAARSQRFTILLNSLFGLQPGFIEDYVAGVEKYVKVRQKDTILRGKADELFGNVVIEFERDLTAAGKQDEAERQLRTYVACLWSQEPERHRTHYACIATDGVIFAVYTPVLEDPCNPCPLPEDVRLEPAERLDAREMKEPGDLYFWLDRYLLRRDIMAPRSENIVKDFGVRSHAFQVANNTLLSLWNCVKGQPEFAVVYEAWGKYLRIVYGSALADEALFIRHTYLATLAKLMAWARLVKSTTADSGQIRDVLEGQSFKDQGFENFLEEDFFSWPARPPVKDTGTDVARMLLGLLGKYNLRELSEDVLKSLYQELVDPETRHDLGEYYTPDWLAARMVSKLLEKNPRASVLDPACGSGTFLYQAVRIKKHLLDGSAETLAHIQDSVVGVEIHPLAVIVAKTNYILALGDLLRNRRGKISIPIYLANAIRLPQPWMRGASSGASYGIELDGQKVYIPEKMLNERGLYDQAIEAAREFALLWSQRTMTEDDFKNYLAEHHRDLAADKDLTDAVYGVAQTLRKFIEERRDSIWAFVLKNAYKPLFLTGRFDLVVGNPPWLSYRYVQQLDYQRFLKEQITQNYRLLSGKAELITHMELGTLFLLRAAELYLKEGGTIAFVLPRSIFSADQHDALRQGTFKGVHLTWSELWDLEGVEPLFNVPSCVLFGRKTTHPSPADSAERPNGLRGEVLSGRLPRRNADLAKEAAPALKVEEVQFFLNQRGKRSFWGTKGSVHGTVSPYRKRFFQGATIVPRAFWFVEIVPSPLGFDPNLPPLVTSQRAQEQAKDAYQGIVFKGSVESRFLYATMLSTDLLPFGHMDYRLVVLPIEPEGDHYRLLTSDQARRRGYIRLAEWLERVQGEWEKRRGPKAEKHTALEWLDYRRKLSTQNPQAPYRVLYITSGTYVCASAVKNKPIEVEISGQQVQANGFLADCVTYNFEVENEHEAHYLTAILNAPITDRLIKPTQAKGLWGPRHIHKKVLDLPIPQFDPAQPEHRRLAELGKACSERVAHWVAAGGPGKTRSIGRLRGMVREMLREELAEIDECTTRILGTATRPVENQGGIP